MTVYTIPVDSERVRFQGNFLTTVPADYFQNLPNLYLIYLYSNSILTVAHYAFAGVLNVTEISLEHNDLSLIHENMFAGLPNLVRLDLSSNLIGSIHPGSFKENTALASLDLEDNDLATVSQSMFNPEDHPCDSGLYHCNIVHHTHPSVDTLITAPYAGCLVDYWLIYNKLVCQH